MTFPSYPKALHALILDTPQGVTHVVAVSRHKGPVQARARKALADLGAPIVHMPQTGHTTPAGVFMRIVEIREAAHIRILWDVASNAPRREAHKCES